MSLRCKMGIHRYFKRTPPSGVFTIVCERCGDKKEYPAPPPIRKVNGQANNTQT